MPDRVEAYKRIALKDLREDSRTCNSERKVTASDLKVEILFPSRREPRCQALGIRRLRVCCRGKQR